MLIPKYLVIPSSKEISFVMKNRIKGVYAESIDEILKNAERGN